VGDPELLARRRRKMSFNYLVLTSYLYVVSITDNRIQVFKGHVNGIMRLGGRC
jgi:hypothetical protein